MQVKILSKEEAATRASELLSLPIFRPSHRLVNIFDKKSNTVYLTEFQDYMVARKEEFTLSAQRYLAIETKVDDLIQFLPEEVQGVKDIMAFTAGELYFVIAQDRYFVIGNRYYNNYIRETRTDGFELLGEVAASGQFRAVWLPRIGFAIRALSNHDVRSREGFFGSPDYDAGAIELRQREISGIFILVNSNGDQIFEYFDEDHDQLRLLLGAPNETNADSAWRLRHWAYPNEWDIDGESSYRSRRYDAKRRLVIRGGFTPVNIEPGSGKVEVLGRDGVAKVDNCVPWTEYSYVETFYS